MQKFGIFRTQGIFRILFILVNSGIFNNDSFNINFNFLFHFNLTYFSPKFKMTYVFLTNRTSISMLD